MTFQICALPKAPFQHFFDRSDSQLVAQNARRVIADEKPGFPCRVSLKDAEPGEELFLVNHQHLSGNSPYDAAHAIYVRKNAAQAQPAAGMVPDVLACRLLSVRGFDAECMMRDADVVDGKNLAAKLEEMLANPDIAFVDIHNAKQGCFAAKAVRA